jgi:hypothetical protein
MLDILPHPTYTPLSGTALSAISTMPKIVKAATASSVKLSTSAKIVSFYHAALFSPTLTTLIEAVKRGFIKFPGLTSEILTSHPPVSVATSLGHLDQARQGVSSTREEQYYDEIAEDWFPLPRASSANSHEIITRIINVVSAEGRIHSDLTGKFPIPARIGVRYLLIMFSEEANYIHAEPLRSRSATDFVTSYENGIKFWKKHGVTPTFCRMDNETSTLLEEFCRRQSPPISIQYVPPGNHRANKAERAIRSWKNHFISGLVSTDNNFPMEAWDELIYQAELTLNLLRSSAVCPYVSAWQQLHGSYDFLSNPIAPPGMKIVAHEKPKTGRGSWDPHGKTGYYLGPALSHYRCFRVWITETKSVRVTDTISWHPPPAHLLPGSTPTDDLLAILAQLHSTISSIADSPPDFMDQCQPIANVISPLSLAIDALKSIFQRKLPSVPIQLATSKGETNLGTIKGNVSSPSIPPSAQASKMTDTRTRVRHPPTHLKDYAMGASMQDAFVLNDENRPLRYVDTLASRDKDLWRLEDSKELLRLIRDTGTMHFIDPSSKPKQRIASYYNPQVSVKTKDGVIVRRVRGTYGGNVSDYQGDKSALTAGQTTVKLLLNAVVSEDAKFMTADAKDFYLGTPMENPEYMWIKREQIPADIADTFSSSIIWVGDRAMVKIVRGIYGLPQAGKLAQEKLNSLLAKHGYHQTPNTPCLYRHDKRNIAFTLVVDDFGVKYSDKDDVQHLLNAIREEYELTEDWTGAKYLGISIAFAGTLYC